MRSFFFFYIDEYSDMIEFSIGVFGFMEEKFRKIQEKTIVLFAVLILAVSFYLTALLSGQSNYVLKESASNLIAAHNRQMELNIDAYLNKVEKAASLLFAEEEYYTYDPEDESDPYENQKIEEAMGDRINDLGILDNYTDFAVVYENDDVIGWVSKLTRGMYTDTSMYDAFDAILSAEKSGDRTWVYGLNGNTDHLYYLQRYNDRAVIMVSFYAHELKNYFILPDQLEGMSVALVNEDNDVLYANKEEMIGQKLPGDTVKRLGDVTDGSVMTKEKLLTSNTCDNGWRIVCAIDNEDIIGENRRASQRSMIFVMAATALILWFGIRRARKMNLSAAGIVETLQSRAEHDRMTGLYNKTEFETAADLKLAHQTLRHTYCFTIIDIDRFKEINDTCGHNAGDAVLKEFADLLKENFADGEYMLGRLGGDEFGIFAEMEGADRDEAGERIAAGLMNVRRALAEKDFGLGDLKPSFSSGTVQAEKEDTSFVKLYERADRLLYHGKNSGRGRDEREADHEEEN